MPDTITRPKTFRRTKTPTVLQMEAVECGAAALAMILAYHGLYIPLEKLRLDCGVSRDGSKASNMLRAARKYNLDAKGFRMELENVYEVLCPAIIFWNFNHFVVLEGFAKDRVYLNDPGKGPRTVTYDEFDKAFTGVILTFEKTPDFKPGGEKPSMSRSLIDRLKGSQGALMYVILVTLFLAIPGLVIPVFSKIFVDDILSRGVHFWIYPLAWGMLVTMILQGILTWLQQYYLLRLETKFAVASSSKFFWHVLRLPIDFFTQRYPGDIAGRVAINDRIAQLLSGQLATNVINLLLVIFYALVMFFYDVILTVTAIGIAILNFVFLRFISRKRIDSNKRLQQEKGKIMGTAMEGLKIIETLKATGSESDFFAKWSGYQANVISSQQRLGFSTQVLNVIPPALNALNSAVILTLGGIRVIDGSMTAGMLVAYTSLTASFMGPINHLVSLGSQIQEAEADMNRLDDVLKYDIDINLRQTDSLTSADPDKTKLSGDVELRDVTFGYSRLSPPLIEKFSLTLRPGSRVALVGGSGSGKSTISKLVSGLYEHWEGEILFDGRKRTDIPRDVISNSISMVDQDIFLFDGTVKENITMWDSTIPDQDIILAAKDAFIHDDIAGRAGGYDSRVDEGGVNFSGGQRQRIEISRALAINPTVVILDEATSALDPKTEQIVDANLRRRGCTCLIVAHRLSTIRDCDEIIVLDNGKVSERGTHEQLIAREGRYRDLIKMY